MQPTICGTEIAECDDGVCATIRVRLAGTLYQFQAITEGRAEAERWIDDAKHRVRLGYTPQVERSPKDCPLRPADAFR